MTTHTINKGFDLRLKGQAEMKLDEAPEPILVAVEPPDFPGIKPRLLVAEGDAVQTGQPLFFNKLDPDVYFCSPATGTVKAVELGARRFPMRVVVEPGPQDQYYEGEKVDAAGLASIDRQQLITLLKKAGLWPLIRQRPVGRIAQGDRVPVAVYVNGMDTEPLAADPAFATDGRREDLQAGVDVLRQLTDGKIDVTLKARGEHQSELRGLGGVEIHEFDGPHPAGLVGTHINSIAPLRADQVAWYVKAQELVLIGHWLRTGHYPTHRIVALAGTQAPTRRDDKIRQGALLATLTGGKALEGDIRLINGTVLSGTSVEPTGYLGFYAATVTAMPEGTGRRDLFGWATPGLGKRSFHRAVWSWLRPNAEYDLDAQSNGGRRPIVDVGAWESVMPLDIHPTYLVRAIEANDLEEALNLGLLEVTEEDVALCTFVDASKIEVGDVIRKGLDLYEAEG